MARVRKYVNFSDTEIDVLLDTFHKAIKMLENGEFELYVDRFYNIDKMRKSFNVDKFKNILFKIRNFIENKKNKLRVRNDLKLNKELLLSNIFGDCDITDNDIFQIKIMLDFLDETTDIEKYEQEKVEWYKEIYDDYIKEKENKIYN